MSVRGLLVGALLLPLAGCGGTGSQARQAAIRVARSDAVSATVRLERKDRAERPPVEACPLQPLVVEDERVEQVGGVEREREDLAAIPEKPQAQPSLAARGRGPT